MPRPRHRNYVPILAAVAAVCALAGLFFLVRGRGITRAQCTEMLDRYIDMSIDLDPELGRLSPAQRDVAREMKRAIRKTEKDFAQVEDQCEAKVRHHEYDCAMHAKTPNDWEACLD
ncbi:hypothetical protein [Pendulispora albinea]|uniref:Uncharacterized protein n=1 Tax=Pendulispora albinea TaxID=2741071 RepID=A0ABZ2M1B2_9BACT